MREARLTLITPLVAVNQVARPRPLLPILKPLEAMVDVEVPLVERLATQKDPMVAVAPAQDIVERALTV